MARKSREETFAIHWCCFVYCCWLVGGNWELTGLFKPCTLALRSCFEVVLENQLQPNQLTVNLSESASVIITHLEEPLDVLKFIKFS